MLIIIIIIIICFIIYNIFYYKEIYLFYILEHLRFRL
jgi:hypothetical protein